MREFFSELIMPLNILWLTIIISVTLLLFRKIRAAGWLFSFSVIWLFFIATPFLPDLLVKKLEDQYPPLNLEKSVSNFGNVHIIVLGAGVSHARLLSATDRLTNGSLWRLVAGYRLYRTIPESVLVFTGDHLNDPGDQVETMTMAAMAMGADSSRIRKIDRVSDTYDEAYHYRSVIGNCGPLIVVTDAIHMPRAMKLFREAGLDPIACPTNYLLNKHEGSESFLTPSSANIRKMEMATHEYAGLVWNSIGTIRKNHGFNR